MQCFNVNVNSSTRGDISILKLFKCQKIFPCHPTLIYIYQALFQKNFVSFSIKQINKPKSGRFKAYKTACILALNKSA